MSRIGFFFLIYVITKVSSDCAFQEDCGLEERCYPDKPDEIHKKPYLINSSYSYLCPDYKDKMGCCSHRQLYKLTNNFETIDQVFGKIGQGCDICATNLKRFWCHFTCSPNQTEFLKIGNRTNHTIEGKIRLLLDINFTIDEDTNCEIFKSCKKAKFVSQVPSMGNSIGFANFQGINAYTKSDVYILMNQVRNKGLAFNIDKCNSTIINGSISGFNVSSCSCNTCDLLCDYNLVFTTRILNGLNWITVALSYVIVFICTIAIFFWKKSRSHIVEDDEFLSFQRSSITN